MLLGEDWVGLRDYAGAFVAAAPVTGTAIGSGVAVAGCENVGAQDCGIDEAQDCGIDVGALGFWSVAEQDYGDEEDFVVVEASDEPVGLDHPAVLDHPSPGLRQPSDQDACRRWLGQTPEQLHELGAVRLWQQAELQGESAGSAHPGFDAVWATGSDVACQQAAAELESEHLGSSRCRRSCCCCPSPTSLSCSSLSWSWLQLSVP